MGTCGSEFRCSVTRSVTRARGEVKGVKLIGDEVANELGLRGVT